MTFGILIKFVLPRKRNSLCNRKFHIFSFQKARPFYKIRKYLFTGVSHQLLPSSFLPEFWEVLPRETSALRRPSSPMCRHPKLDKKGWPWLGMTQMTSHIFVSFNDIQMKDVVNQNTKFILRFWGQLGSVYELYWLTFLLPNKFTKKVSGIRTKELEIWVCSTTF